MTSFISDTNYNLFPGVLFPYKEVLGIIAYPVTTDSTIIHLGNIITKRAVKIENTCIDLHFYDSNDTLVLIGVVQEFGNYTNDQEDYKIDLVDPLTKQGCGCMVVSTYFMQWLMHTPFPSTSIKRQALIINPTYVHSKLYVNNNTLRVNGKAVTHIVFDNTRYEDKGLFISNKPEIEQPLPPPKGMTKLVIQSSDNEITLEGKSIGFAISAPPDAFDVNNPEYCRVHIETTENQINFIDQSTNL